jgi:PTS system cellobiose-specific IIA component
LSNELDLEQTLFTFILHAGNARSLCKEAAEFAQESNWDEAQSAMEAANAEQLKAHEINAQLIRREASGEQLPFSVLLVHAMDLLLLAWSEFDFTEQTINMSKRVAALEEEVAGWRRQQTGV